MILQTNDEKSLLLYFETQSVDYGGLIESVRMNDSDFAKAKEWDSLGFVQFGRIAHADIKIKNGVARDYWCVLSDDAWLVAHAERRKRSERVMSKLTIQRNGLSVAA
jgi:hypothetical protein